MLVKDIIIKENQEYYENLLEELFEIESFKNLLEDPTELMAAKFTYDIECYFDDITFNYGCTKFVINPNDSDYVLKFPLYKVRDLCAREVEIYNEVVDTEAEQMFAPCYFLFNKYDTDFYIMEKAECDNDYSNISLEEDLVSHFISDGCDEESAYDKVGEMCSEEQVQDLLGYYYDYDTLELFGEISEKFDINDLHGGNVGYLDGRIVLIDYSGYRKGDIG